MERSSDRHGSPQILGYRDFTPVDPSTIVMVSPPSSPEPVTPADDDSAQDFGAGVAENKPHGAEFSGKLQTERATTSKSPSSAVGKVRVLGKERGGPHVCSRRQQASAVNVRLSSGKRPNVSDSPSSSGRGEARGAGNILASAGKFGVSAEKDPNAGISGGGEGGTRRMLPPTIAASAQWGGGKWKEDWRTKRKKVDEKTDTMFLKEVIEALLRNSGDAEEEDDTMKNFSYVEALKSMGIKFPE